MAVHSTPSRRVKIAAVIVGVVGIWGAVIPFVGPSFGYGMGNSQASRMLAIYDHNPSGDASVIVGLQPTNPD